jgi:O-antigen/teichoic acid export membrane protein
MITIGVAPILTRLYDPSVYGLFAIYTSISAMIAVLATGRYDVAIMLPERDRDAVNLVALSSIITLTVSTATLVGVLCSGAMIARWVGNEEIGPWLYMVPLTVGITGLYQAMYCWTNRQRRFRHMSVAKVSGAVAGASTSVGLGLAWGSTGGLILGTVLNQSVSSGVFLYRLVSSDRAASGRIRGGLVRAMARRYYRFPLYSLPADFINVAAQQMPVILLTSFFDPTVVGLFALTQRALSYPLTLIASSILDVFRQRASADYTLRGNCREIFMKTFKSLMVISVLPFTLLFFLAPWLFSVVFGRQWEAAGDYARILAPFFMIRFVASPLSYVLYVAEKQHIDMIWQMLLLVSTSMAIVIGGSCHDPGLAVMLYAGAYAVMYLAYLGLSYHYSAGRS